MFSETVIYSIVDSSYFFAIVILFSEESGCFLFSATKFMPNGSKIISGLQMSGIIFINLK